MVARLSNNLDTSVFFISHASATVCANAPLDIAVTAFMPFIFGAMARFRGWCWSVEGARKGRLGGLRP